MDASEKLVADHLAHRGFTNVIYEPDGNVTPDFSVDGNVAIEVRRLNQNHYDGTNTKGLEETSISLWKNILNLLNDIGTPIADETWFVHFRFSRPVEQWKKLRPSLHQALTDFAASETRQGRVIFENQGFELEVYCRASTIHSTTFILAGCSDQDSGGWLLAEMSKNISHCASEKSRKIAAVRPKYQCWWLALVDHIGYGLDKFDRDQFQSQISIEHDWDKIIIIDPRDHTRWFEI